MKREDKNLIIDDLTQNLNEYGHFYLADISALNADDTSSLRRKCFDSEVKLMVVKNTLLKKALEKAEKDYNDIFETLKGNTSIMFCNTANIPAKVIKDFRRTKDKPILKSAFVEETFFIGDQMLDTLVNLKSKEELVADVIALLQSPAKNVISALKSGGNILTGVLKTLSERS
jgi:large subunit ribosomal protein L10